MKQIQKTKPKQNKTDPITVKKSQKTVKNRKSGEQDMIEHTQWDTLIETEHSTLIINKWISENGKLIAPAVVIFLILLTMGLVYFLKKKEANTEGAAPLENGNVVNESV